MLNYRLEGSGPPLLLIHGWGVTFTIWKNLAPLLRPHFQLVMVELPGFGQSPPPSLEQPYFQECVNELEALRRHLKIDQWAVLCYSVGTRVGEAYVRAYPGGVGSVIFLCPLYTGLTRVSTLRLLVKLDRLLPELGDWALSGWRISLLIRALGFNGQRHPYVRDWKQEVSLQPRRSLKMVLREVPRYASKPISSCNRPVIYIWGKYDRLVKRPRRPLPGHYVIRATHSAPMQAAPQVAEIVVCFLRGVNHPREEHLLSLDKKHLTRALFF